ncbi:hypothetical protein [Proteus mirabilis]|uniref:hypothetical protein n=2 Tax=Proteus mirabilis TaxID=584 RepID=UPI001F23E187|nr:hypothetical protein [Proteus mirabilis]MCT8239882.1 hypothetical protein [Proteus mirabilis]
MVTPIKKAIQSRLIKYQDINKYPLGYFIYSAQRNLPKEWLTYFDGELNMLVSEMAKDIEALQTRTLALEYIIQVMIRNMSDIEKKKLISELNRVSHDSPVTIEAFGIIQSHLHN